jgi:hypothetical protein
LTVESVTAASGATPQLVHFAPATTIPLRKIPQKFRNIEQYGAIWSNMEQYGAIF